MRETSAVRLAPPGHPAERDGRADIGAWEALAAWDTSTGVCYAVRAGSATAGDWAAQAAPLLEVVSENDAGQVFEQEHPGRRVVRAGRQHETLGMPVDLRMADGSRWVLVEAKQQANLRDLQYGALWMAPGGFYVPEAGVGAGT